MYIYRWCRVTFSSCCPAWFWKYEPETPNAMKSLSTESVQIRWSCGLWLVKQLYDWQLGRVRGSQCVRSLDNRRLLLSIDWSSSWMIDSSVNDTRPASHLTNWEGPVITVLAQHWLNVWCCWAERRAITEPNESDQSVYPCNVTACIEQHLVPYVKCEVPDDCRRYTYLAI